MTDFAVIAFQRPCGEDHPKGEGEAQPQDDAIAKSLRKWHIRRTRCVGHIEVGLFKLVVRKDGEDGGWLTVPGLSGGPKSGLYRPLLAGGSSGPTRDQKQRAHDVCNNVERISGAERSYRTTQNRETFHTHYLLQEARGGTPYRNTSSISRACDAFWMMHDCANEDRRIRGQMQGLAIRTGRGCRSKDKQRAAQGASVACSYFVD